LNTSCATSTPSAKALHHGHRYLCLKRCCYKAGNSTQDPEADYNVKQSSDGKRKTTYGIKAHINVDEDGFIKATAFTAGNVHDSNHFTQLLSGDESAGYADSAYKVKSMMTGLLIAASTIP
jgi:hypothetical protein